MTPAMTLAMTPAMPAEVQAVFQSWPAPVRSGLSHLRRLIFAEAARLPAIGAVTEALRWGQPAYLTLQTGSGCSLRIGPAKAGDFALFVHCRTDLIESFRAGPGHAMRVQGNRAVLFADAAEIDDAALPDLIRRALTYHLTQRGRAKQQRSGA